MVISRLWPLAAFSEFPLIIRAGWLSDRVGRLLMLSSALLCSTAELPGYGLMLIYPWIPLIQLARGFALAAVVAACMTYATEVTSQAERGRASGLYSAARDLGAMLGQTLGGWLTQLLGFMSMTLTSTALVFVGAIYLGGVHAQWHRRR